MTDLRDLFLQSQVKSVPSERPILIVDGLSLFVRHFLGNPAMSLRHEPVGGVVGFLGTLATVISQMIPSKVIVIWESGGSPRKRAIFPDYKANRRPQKTNRYLEDVPDTVDNRNWQLSVIVEILKRVPAIQIYVENCEADDVIGYLSRYRFSDMRKLILSSDKDYYQLLDDKTEIYTPGRREIITSQKVRDHYNIDPVNFALAKSVCGDASDNIPGVRGVGFKTFAKRFPRVRERDPVSVEDIIRESTETASTSKVKIYSSVAAEADTIRRNWKLILLDTSNLAASQIKRAESSVDCLPPKQDKMGLLRLLVKEGVTSFDADRLLMAFNSVTRT